jgi:hypothetical protein
MSGRSGTSSDLLFLLDAALSEATSDVQRSTKWGRFKPFWWGQMEPPEPCGRGHRKGEARLSQIAKDFGISESCLHRWLKLADVAQTAESSLEREHIRQCLEGLIALQRQSIVLACYGGFSYRQVAGQLSLPLRTVKARIAMGSSACAAAWSDPANPHERPRRETLGRHGEPRGLSGLASSQPGHHPA